MSGFCPCALFSTLFKNLIVLQLMVILVSHVHVAAKGHNHTESLTLTTAATMEIQATPFIHAALISDLKVSAQVYNATRRLLQLLVSWKPPTSGRMPDDYNLHVYPVDTNPFCATFTSYVVVDKNHTNATVPKIQDPVMTDVTRIRPGCTYKVVVESNPHNGRENTSVNYTVPECVGAICSCQHASTLPRPTSVKAAIAGPRHVDVSWRLPPSPSFNISKFVVSMGHQISWSQGRRQHLFNTSWVQDMEFFGDVDKGTQHVTQIVTHTDLVRNLTYRVEVFVVDSQRCEGPRTNYTFIVPLEENSKTSWLLVTVLSIVSFVVVFILATVTICQQCGSWARRKLGEGRLQPVKSWRGLYKAVNLERMGPHITRANFPIQEMNVLYVEKEIEEATLRGDADRYEISYGRLELGRQIGKGAFGRVFLARAEAIAGIPGYITVAVKKLKLKATADEIEEFLSEITMMKKVGHHPNIVTMLGCCTLKQPYCMIMEYIPCGDLLQYLRQLRVEYERRTGNLLSFTSSTHRPIPTHAPRYVHLQHHLSESEGSYIQPDIHICASIGRPSIAETEWSLLTSDGASSTSTHLVPHRKQLEYVLDPKELQNFAVQIARGMAHLEQKLITHRDLAARNVLIDGNKTLKISDFGLSRSGIYVNTKRKKVPLRWLSIEAMRDNLYSSKSDVWAFAIVLWEIGTLGGFPYPTVADIDLLSFLLEGKRLEKPDNCTDELYTLMLHCWSHSADARPSFADLVAHLDSATSRKRVYVDFNSLRPDYSFPPTEQQAPALASTMTAARGTSTTTRSK